MVAHGADHAPRNRLRSVTEDERNMALASQSARTPSLGRVAGGARWSRRRGRTRRKIRFGLAAAGVAGLIAVYLWAPWRSPSGPEGAPIASITDAPEDRAQPAQREARPDAANIGLAATNALANPSRSVPTMEMGNPPAPTTPPAASRVVPSETERTIAGVPVSRSEPEVTPVRTPADTLPGASRFSSPEPVRSLLDRAAGEADRNRPAEARLLYNRALADQRTTAQDRAMIRERMGAISQVLTLSPTVVPTDPLSETYVIRSGDSLSKIAAQNDLKIDWRFLQRVNRIADPRRIRVGQSIKLVRGPFHAVVSKSQYRLDLYADLPSSAGGGLVYITSFPVGLGEYSSTPLGSWVVRKNSKLINPPWTNPRTGEYFSADNPLNPIGERWIGIEGTDDTTRQISGIGIHGTIEPQSIGADASMGCVRMLADDVEIIYELLSEGVSTIEIVP